MGDILVTGATGFVGAAVARRLLAAGKSLRILHRAGSDLANIQGLAGARAVGDLGDPASLKRAVSGCEAVYHVAADYRLWVPRPEEIYRINVDGSVALVRAAMEAGVRRIVYCSSVAVLGIRKDGTASDETTPVSLADMIGHYKRSKFLAEEAVRKLVAEEKAPVVIVNPSTLAPALIALGASAEVLGSSGKRKVELAKFFHAPRGPNDREHTLTPNEIVLSVTFDIPSDKHRSASYEVRHKQSYDWPLVQAAVAFTLDGKVAKNVRIVLGHVAPTPLLSESAARAVEGKEVTEETAAAAGQAACEGVRPLSQNGYKVQLLAVAVKRALLTAAGAPKSWE